MNLEFVEKKIIMINKKVNIRPFMREILLKIHIE